VSRPALSGEGRLTSCLQSGSAAVRAGGGCSRSNLSVSRSGRDKLKILGRHGFEERFVRALGEWPEHGGGLSAGVPVLAAADPDGSGKGGAETGEEFLGRAGGRRHRGTTRAGLCAP